MKKHRRMTLMAHPPVFFSDVQFFWCPSPLNSAELWPIALPERYAGIPSKDITKADLVGSWENINLVYDYGKQDASSKLTLKEDGTMTGAFTGKWSYDQSKKQLTLGDVVVVVEREADWEASPRVATIVYAGIGKDASDNAKTITYWGKKVQ